MSQSRVSVWLLAASFAFLPGDSPVTAVPRSGGTPRLDRKLPARVERVYRAISTAFSPVRAMEVVTFMSASWRLPGNPAFEGSQDLIARRLEKAGFTLVTEREKGGPAGLQWYEEYPATTPAWEPVNATLETVDGDGNENVEIDMSRPLDRVSLCINSFSTAPGGVVAPLAAVGRGSDPADYTNIDVRGKIVLGEADTRRLFDMAVRQRGAVGVLSASAAPYTKPDETANLVQWSGIPYDEALHAFAFKISRRLATRLRERLGIGPVTAKVVISTRFRQRPHRTLVAEIPGRLRPDERVVLVAHVQEPGANDNASGCATLLELARALATGVARGSIPPPARTVTFLWGNEIAASRQWLRTDESRAPGTRYAFSLDMTGEDVSKTGGTFLIEKQPDPSAVWVRPSDPHTEWGSGIIAADTLKGNLLNDLHLAVCLRRARDTQWVVKTNPYEGGSDHSVFLEAGIPALLDWHFTDRYYHTNLDTPDKTSPAEMANVGVAVGTTAWLLASSDDRDAKAVVDLVEEAALARLELEARQSRDAIAAAADEMTARRREEMIGSTWRKWYVEALQSVLDLPVGKPSPALKQRVDRAVRRIRPQT